MFCFHHNSWCFLLTLASRQTISTANWKERQRPPSKSLAKKFNFFSLIFSTSIRKKKIIEIASTKFFAQSNLQSSIQLHLSLLGMLLHLTVFCSFEQHPRIFLNQCRE